MPQHASLLQRYRAGDRRTVWAELHALGPLETFDFARRDDVLAVVDVTVRRAARNVRTIHARLVSLGYIFDYPGNNAFGEADAGLEETVALFTNLGPLPPVIARFCALVGTVCLRGWLPSAGDEDSWKAQLIDPLEFLPDYDVNGSDVEPFFAVNCRAKNGNLKEFGRSRLLIPAPGVDARVLEANSTQTVWFVEYLRSYFTNGGFCTVAETQHTPTEFVRFLASDLLEI